MPLKQNACLSPSSVCFYCLLQIRLIAEEHLNRFYKKLPQLNYERSKALSINQSKFLPQIIFDHSSLQATSPISLQSLSSLTFYLSWLIFGSNCQGNIEYQDKYFNFQFFTPNFLYFQVKVRLSDRRTFCTYTITTLSARLCTVWFPLISL